ncbi:hypothetical protein PLICRDRAFT_132211 [Plicaturopsis crispa FD-325 SS-3]|nr:hypothetical protein PLICRDRAFT_132211 [Plicaturopsis crispa FD-325 SS-3]
MDDDVDMEAPHISTLREEDSPPPQPSSSRPVTSKFRVKLLVNESNRPGSSSAARKVPQRSDDEDEDEDEEDQLIDDDDDDMRPSISAPPRPVDSQPKRKVSTSKRRPRKRPQEEEKAAKSPLHADNQVAEGMRDTDHPVSAPVPSKPPRKRAPRRKVPGSAPTLPRKSAYNRPTNKVLLAPSVEDAGVVSEGYTGTAASSPVTVQHDGNSPEPESAPPVVVPPVEEINLEGIPLPVYPIPHRPYPVQPPPKIGTGFAPVIPLDRSRAKVRHWRTANREIRGIAGGRWFTRAWVGDKESELAAHKAMQSEAGGEKSGVPSATLPKLAGPSLSTSPSGKLVGKFKATVVQSVSSTAPGSRAGSAVPDPHAVRAPTKMRTIVAPSSDAGDSDMIPTAP